MEIERFTYDKRPYVVSLQNSTSFVVWTEIPDDFHYGEVNFITSRLHKPKNSIRLVRRVWKIVQGYVYKSRLSYFEVSVDDTVRANLYSRSTLRGYHHFRYGNNFLVLRLKGEQT